MSKLTESPYFDRIPDDQVKRYVTRFAAQVAQTINGGLDLSNFNGVTISVPFATANVDQVALHGLNRIPTGYIVLSATAAMSVYDGATPSTSSAVYLRSSATGTARVLIF